VSSAVAQSAENAVVQQLSRQGYGDIRVGHTLLGRARITGERNGVSREIVVNPRTGEILRDYSKKTGAGIDVQLINPFGAGNPSTSSNANEDDGNNSGSGRGKSGQRGDDQGGDQGEDGDGGNGGDGGDRGDDGNGGGDHGNGEGDGDSSGDD